MKEIAARVERKLYEQIAEFNVLRDRILAVIGFSLALLTLIFMFLDKIKLTYNIIIFGLAILPSLISIAILIYAAITKPLCRGMDTKLIKELIDSSEGEDGFFLHDISYNLESFKDNVPKLEKIRNKLNLALVIQSIVALVFGLFTYLNNIIK